MGWSGLIVDEAALKVGRRRTCKKLPTPSNHRQPLMPSFSRNRQCRTATFTIMAGDR